jgi:hypothetical protein
MPSSLLPVLLVGGSGIVGSHAARALRKLHPDLPLAIGGRDLTKAVAVATQVGHAAATKVDLGRADLGLPNDAAFSAMAVFVKDETLNSMRYAQQHGIPYISISSGSFEIGPEVAQYIHAPTKAPILLASHWLAGAAVFPVLALAASYESIESIRIGVLLDEQDTGGPAAHADYNRITSAAPAALTLENGRFHWATGETARADYTSVDGVTLDAQAYSPFDIMALAAATDAASVRLDLAYSVSASRRRGGALSTEIVIDLHGMLKTGEHGRTHHEIVHPDGQAPLTALGVALAIERMLGLAGGEPPAPGLYLPEVLIDPAYYVRRMQEFGATFQSR